MDSDRSSAGRPSFLCLLAPYFSSLVLVIIGVYVGGRLITVSDADLMAVAAERFDGNTYIEIAESGYSYSPSKSSNVAHFPAYPLLGRITSDLAGWPIAASLVLISNVALVGAIFVFHAYLGIRGSQAEGFWFRSAQGPLREASCAANDYTLLLFAYFPITLFFRMAYAESLFVATSLTVFYVLERWRAVYVAAVISGMLSAIRPVGVAAIPLLIVAGWNRGNSIHRNAARAIVLALCGSCGLVAYSAYQQIAFGDALAFAKTQTFWRIRPDVSLYDQALSLVAGEPIWSVYDENSIAYWMQDPFRQVGNPLLNLQFWNPVVFVLTCLAICVGWLKGWLSRAEVLYSTIILLIGYLTRGFEMGMNSQARFCIVVFPAYIVFGIVLAKLPRLLAISCVACAGAFLAVFCALFAAGYQFY